MQSGSTAALGGKEKEEEYVAEVRQQMALLEEASADGDLEGGGGCGHSDGDRVQRRQNREAIVHHVRAGNWPKAHAL